MLSQSCSGRSSSLKVPSRDSASPFTHISRRQASPHTTISRGRAYAFTTPSRGRSTPLNATFRGRSSTLSTLLLLAFLPIIGKLIFFHLAFIDKFLLGGRGRSPPQSFRLNILLIPFHIHNILYKYIYIYDYILFRCIIMLRLGNPK